MPDIFSGSNAFKVEQNAGVINYNAAPVAPILRATPLAPPLHFTGREDDLAKFTQILTPGRNVAITALHGMGGIGKTALAQKLAERLNQGDNEGRPYFSGGVLWWTLGPSADVFTALDVWAHHADPRADLTALPTAEARAEAVRPMLARLGRLCVIIDDVWDEAAARILMNAIPPDCPILITTRDGDLAKSLRCRVERIDALSDDDAVALLEKLLGPLEIGEHSERSREAAESKSAHAERSTPLRSAQDAYSAARDIAHLTERLPLALELIAGIADLPADLPALARELYTKPTLDVLKRGKTREQSIEACFTMSYERLDADMQRRFRALGVFAPAPFDRDAIAAVWDEEGDSGDEAIKFLARRSLLTRLILPQWGAAQSRSEVEATPSGPPALRAGHGQNLLVMGDTFEEFHQHALLRDYAVKLLNPLPHPPWSEKAPTGEGAIAPSPVRGSREEGQSVTPEQRTGEGWEGGSRHAAYYRRFAEEEDWRNVEHFFDQIDHGWQWMQANAPDQIIDYVFAAQDFLRNRGRQSERLKWLNAGVAQARVGKDRKREGTRLNNIGYLHEAIGQKDKALDFYQQALAIRRQVGDRSGEGTTLNNIGLVYDNLGQKDKALDFYQQALVIHREVGNRSGEGTALNNIGKVYDDLGQKDKALAISREVGDRSGEGTTLNNLGGMYDDLGQKDQALDFYQQSLAIFREVGNRWSESTLSSNIGLLLDEMSRTAEAVTYLEQCVALDEAIGHPDLESDRAKLERVRGKLGQT